MIVKRHFVFTQQPMVQSRVVTIRVYVKIHISFQIKQYPVLRVAKLRRVLEILVVFHVLVAVQCVIVQECVFFLINRSSYHWNRYSRHRLVHSLVHVYCVVLFLRPLFFVKENAKQLQRVCGRYLKQYSLVLFCSIQR